MRLLVLVTLAGIAGGLRIGDVRDVGRPREKRQARATVQGCTVNPSGIDDPKTPAKENTAISINCNTDREYHVCAIQHMYPMSVGQSTGNNNNNNNNYMENEMIRCMSDKDKNGQTCSDDNRITYQNTLTNCGVRIGRSSPEDTGRWTFTVTEYAAGTGSETSSFKSIVIYTFNRTIVDFTDSREAEIRRDIEVWFNYDDNEETYRSGTGGYEQVELNCNARGGRPEPKITWMINNDERKAFGEELTNSEADRIFDARESLGSTYDDEGYIRDKESKLLFTVDRVFLDYLANSYGIDTNPSSGQFSFELSCDVDQGDYGNERISTNVNVRRIYFEDKLRASTIGWIVGGVLVGLLLIVLLLVTLWAKGAGRLCFDDSGYDNANDPKRRPRTYAQR